MSALPETVDTPEACVAWVRRVGMGAWRSGTPLPALDQVTPWGSETMLHTWFWKDDLHIAKAVCYAPLWGAGVPVFVDPDLVPALVAAQGDIDPRDLAESGRISPLALRLYEHVERHGPTPKNRLPYPARTSRTPPLVQLQRTWCLTKTGITGRTRGTYGYVWGRADDFWGDAFARAARLSVEEARAQVAQRLWASGVTLSDAALAKALHWPGER